MGGSLGLWFSHILILLAVGMGQPSFGALDCGYGDLNSKISSAGILGEVSSIRAEEKASKNEVEGDFNTYMEAVQSVQQQMLSQNLFGADSFGPTMDRLRERTQSRFLNRQTAAMSKEKAQKYREDYLQHTPEVEKLKNIAIQRAFEWGASHVGSVYYRHPRDIGGGGMAGALSEYAKSPRSLLKPDVVSDLLFSETPGDAAKASVKTQVEAQFGAEGARSIWEAARAHETETSLESMKSRALEHLEAEHTALQRAGKEFQRKETSENHEREFQQRAKALAALESEGELHSAKVKPETAETAITDALSKILSTAERSHKELDELTSLWEDLTPSQREKARSNATDFFLGMVKHKLSTQTQATDTWTAIADLPAGKKSRVKTWAGEQRSALTGQIQKAQTERSRLEQKYLGEIRKGNDPERLYLIFQEVAQAKRAHDRLQVRDSILKKWELAANGWTQSMEATITQVEKDGVAFYDLSHLQPRDRSYLVSMKGNFRPFNWNTKPNYGDASKYESAKSSEVARTKYWATMDQILGVPGAAQALHEARGRYIQNRYRAAAKTFFDSSKKEAPSHLNPLLIAASKHLSYQGIPHRNNGVQILLETQDGIPKPLTPWQRNIDTLLSQGVKLSLSPMDLRSGMLASFNAHQNLLKLPFEEFLNLDFFTQVTFHEIEHFHTLSRNTNRARNHQRHLLRIDFDREDHAVGAQSPIHSTLYGEHQNMGEVEAKFIELEYLAFKLRKFGRFFDPQPVTKVARELENRADASLHLLTEAENRLATDGIADVEFRYRNQEVETLSLAQMQDFKNVTVFLVINTAKGEATIPLSEWPGTAANATVGKVVPWLRTLNNLDASVGAVTTQVSPYLPALRTTIQQAKTYAIQRSQQAKSIQFWTGQPSETKFEKIMLIQKIYQAVTGVGRLSVEGVTLRATRPKWLSEEPQ